jgi:TRAP-type mannitol/chloroaromatic compound transport system permease small subunit
MKRVRGIIQLLDNYTERSGVLVSWLCLAMTLLTCTVVLLRYGFATGSVAAQEAITYMHATLFMLAAAFTLRRDGHVRVDIFYRSFSPRNRAWVNSVGTIVLLLPFAVFILASSWQLVADSWAVREGSQDPGGIHAVFLLKSLIPLMAVNLIIQGVAEICRNTLVLLDAEP